MHKIQARMSLLLLLMQVSVFLLATFGTAESWPLPNIIDAPRNKDDNIPSAIAGSPRPLLDGDGKMIVYDLAATITDEGFDAMESTNIGFLWFPLFGKLNPFW
ncbi:hypothetical protein ZHAS_00021162 [Anopheles sinensis]|uniref:Uncharacterized protein n=1 Tax=Anopheles sinensis TaxID=74873 RepID=A0A084WRP2_ANOSI|nr:hypothetical protein ZHAS_00021162 [Anopheles sinensis]